MTVSLNQVQAGIGAYLRAEIVEKLNGPERWVVGAAVELLVPTIGGKLAAFSEAELVRQLGLVNEAGAVDLDRAYAALKEQARRGPVSKQVPVIGVMTFTEADVDRLYNYIVSQGQTGGGI